MKNCISAAQMQRLGSQYTPPSSHAQTATSPQNLQPPAPEPCTINRGDYQGQALGNHFFLGPPSKNPSTRQHKKCDLRVWAGHRGICQPEIKYSENGNRFLERIFMTVTTPGVQHSGGGKYLSMCAKLPFASDRLPLLPSDFTKNTLWPSPHEVFHFMFTVSHRLISGVLIQGSRVILHLLICRSHRK